MAPIKFEDNLKEKLEQRRLQPSTNAWETLQERLDASNNKNNKKGFWWLGIAASFVGILIIASIFFNQKNDKSTEQNVVDVENVKKPKSINKTILQNETLERVAFEEPKDKKEALKTKKGETEKAPVLKQKQNELISVAKTEVVAQFETEHPNNIKENIIKTDAVLSYEDIKLQEVVAQVQELKKANNTVSDVEINALLDQAQKDIALHNLYNESTKKVDANALLQDVEQDLEQSFRDRAFKAIKSGYNYVKTTVAERNN